MDYLEIRELYHHGIKGQKWGIRRYQNPDGTLTPEGKAKYGTVDNFNNSQRKKKIATAAIGGSLAIGAGVLAGHKYYNATGLDTFNKKYLRELSYGKYKWQKELDSIKRPNSIFWRKDAEHARKVIQEATLEESKVKDYIFLDSVFIGSVASAAVAGAAAAGNKIYSKISKNIANKKIKEINNK